MEGVVIPVDEICATITDSPWIWAQLNRAAIEQSFAQARRENPALFNGRVTMLGSARMEAGRCTAELVGADFAAFLHWRRTGQPDPTVAGTGVSAVLRSAEGHIVVGRAAAHTVNAGKTYLIAGMIDVADADPSGRVDIRQVARRELVEEAGPVAGEAAAAAGLWLVRERMWTTFAAEFRSSLPGARLLAAIRAHLDRQAAPELDLVRLVTTVRQARDQPLLGHARLLIEAVLGREAGC
ncbi:MAG: hypothetical protein R3D33_15755 [Hyphomicrobiaceae bacterium]